MSETQTTDYTPTGLDPPSPTEPLPAKVIIIGADLPFWDLVWLMVKWALAAIPALCILGVIMAFVWSMFIAIGNVGVSIESFTQNRNSERRAQSALANALETCEGGTNEGCMNRHGYHWDGYQWAK